jgi:hypothetical protein
MPPFLELKDPVLRSLPSHDYLPSNLLYNPLTIVWTVTISIWTTSTHTRGIEISPEYPYSKRPINRFLRNACLLPSDSNLWHSLFLAVTPTNNRATSTNKSSFQRQPQVPNLCPHPPQLRRPCGSFYFRYFYLDSFGLCESIQLVIFFLFFLFFWSSELRNYATNWLFQPINHTSNA